MIFLRSALFAVTFYAWLIALLLFSLPLLAFPRSATVWLAHRWTRTALWIARVTLGLRHEIRGRENLPPGPIVIAAKHQSMWDTIIFHLILDHPTYVLKKELTRIPLFGWFVVKYGNVAVDRKAGTKALKHMIEGAKGAIAQGWQIVIFPEGTRTPPGATAPYHSGIAMIYQNIDVPIVPVALNSGLFWPRHRFLKRGGTVLLEILPAMPGDLPRRDFMLELQERIETATGRLIAEAQQPA